MLIVLDTPAPAPAPAPAPTPPPVRPVTPLERLEVTPAVSELMALPKIVEAYCWPMVKIC